MKTQLLKNWNILYLIAVIIIIFSCEKSDDLGSNDVTGTYIGTLTSNLSSRTSNTNLSSKTSNTETILPATLVVSSFGDQIKVHCIAENFVTTVMLDIYNHNDNVMVCLTGEEFQNMYGHMLGQGNMNGQMQNNGSGWAQHLNNEHQEGDEHFGSFDMQHHSFNYTFRMNDGDFHFQGAKN